MAIVLTPHRLSGTVTVPPSKSMAHRAIICASLSKGKSTISNIAYSKDIIATLSAMRALGTTIIENEHSLIIDGSTTFNNHECEIDCNESGSTLRFMIPVSLIHDNHVHLIGSKRLGERPLNVFYDIFDKQDIHYSYQKDALDLSIQGQLLPDTFEIPGDVSSQFISGLLFALPLLNKDSKIVITSPLQSAGYIDLTLQMLKQFSIDIINHDYQELIIPGNQQYQPHDYRVEADFSQAAFYLVAGALNNDIVLKDLNLDSYQGDKVVLDLLQRMGGQLYQTDEGYQMKCDRLHATVIDGSQCPDIVPIMAIACSLAHGTSLIQNIGRLRIKECDRLKATVEVIHALGGNAKEYEDSMEIIGCCSLKGGAVSSYNDHRMAMMEAIASTCCKRSVVIDNKDCVAKSYPNFWEDFTKLGGIIDEC